MQDGLPSISMEPFGIVIAPIGPVEPKFLDLDQVVDTARALAQTGVTVQAITQGLETVLEGSELQAALGETRSQFENFPALRPPQPRMMCHGRRTNTIIHDRK